MWQGPPKPFRLLKLIIWYPLLTMSSELDKKIGGQADETSIKGLSADGEPGSWRGKPSPLLLWLFELDLLGDLKEW
jgi:hypothetical protein